MASKYAIIAARSPWWKAGALFGATGVLLGAFGAHGLKSRIPPVDPKMLAAWNTAAQYQLVHSAALLAAPFARRPGLAGGLLGAGVLLFSGSLYAMVPVVILQRGLFAIGRPAFHSYSLDFHSRVLLCTSMTGSRTTASSARSRPSGASRCSSAGSRCCCEAKQTNQVK